ncbi:cellulase [Trifolium repens]|nr:cellulase [Trifolium repens]
MSNDGHLTRSATSENTVSTPPPTVTNGSMLPPNTKKRKNRSEAWNHFTIVDEIGKIAECNYCEKPIKCGSGTSSMTAHLTRCNEYKKQQMSTSMTMVKDGLKDIDDSVSRIRHAVWYARSSASRLNAFKESIDENLEYKVRMSGSSYLTSNTYMFEILGIGKSIVEMCNSEDAHLRSTAQAMKKKYDKYWGNYKSINMMLLIALVLDPRRKVRLADWMMRRFYNNADADSLKEMLECCLKSLYEEYCFGVMPPQGNVEAAQTLDSVSDPYGLKAFYLSDNSSTSNNELETYLKEDLEQNMKTYHVLNNIIRKYYLHKNINN